MSLTELEVFGANQEIQPHATSAQKWTGVYLWGYYVSSLLFVSVHLLVCFLPIAPSSLAVLGRLRGRQLVEVPSGHRAQHRGGAGPLEHRHRP